VVAAITAAGEREFRPVSSSIDIFQVSRRGCMLGASHVPPDGKGAMEPGFGMLAVLAFILASIAPMTWRPG